MEKWRWVWLGLGLVIGGAQGGWMDVLKGLEGQASSQGMGEKEVAMGLKEALLKGVDTAVLNLGKEGGFLDHPKVRIPLPSSLQPMAKGLRMMGQGRLVDQFETAMNRAAEAAVPEAAPILKDAVFEMPLEDAWAILKGPEDSATRYFRKVSEARLKAKMRPIVEASMSKVGVVASYRQLMDKAGMLGGLFDQGMTDLDGYVTQKALDGLFFMIAEEEKRIRENPAERTTELLKKVFGAR